MTRIRSSGTKLHIGCHLSSSGGFEAMGLSALSIDADTFAFFTRNPRGNRAKEVNPDDAAKLVSLLKENDFAPIVAHASYTLNPCSSTESLRDNAFVLMNDDLRRMEYVPHQYYNFHPGSHTGQGVKVAVEQISTLLNSVLSEELTTTVLLETMSGKGTEVGRSFEELQQIISRVNLDSKVGVCLDTCHIHDAGYDIVNNLDGVLEEFDRIIGLERLKAIHLNDSKNVCGAHKDRHARIGEGYIGLEALVAVTKHPQLRDLPFVLETPSDMDGWAEEIQMLRNA